MGVYVNIFSTVVLILVLVMIYRKSDSSESSLFMKLLGYYFLGSFRFNFNKLAIPLGFILYLAFFRPQINGRSKKYAAQLGLLVFIIGVSVPFISKLVYERPRQITVDSVSINTIDFQKDWQLIKEKLEINEDTKLERFNLSYNADGTIRDLQCELILRRDKGLTHYSIDLLPKKQKYIIRPRKVEQWLQYDRLMTAERFFQNLSLLNIEDTKPSGSYEWYVIAGSGEIVNYAIKEYNKVLIISKDNLREIGNEELPIRGSYISSYGMKKTSESKDFVRHESDKRTDYFFDVIKK